MWAGGWVILEHGTPQYVNRIVAINRADIESCAADVGEKAAIFTRRRSCCVRNFQGAQRAHSLRVGTPLHN